VNITTGRRPARYREPNDHDRLRDVSPTIRELTARMFESRPSAAQLKVWTTLVVEIGLDVRLWDAVSTYRISEITGLDRSNVRRALRALEGLGLIEVQRGGSDSGRRRELSVIGFGPGALGPPVVVVPGGSDRGLCRPQTGGHVDPRPGVPAPPSINSHKGHGGTPSPPAGAGGARSAQDRFADAFRSTGFHEVTESTATRLAKEAGTTLDKLVDEGAVSSLNSMFRMTRGVR
jgi:DNA-binding transcriptional ArsR family regulator